MVKLLASNEIMPGTCPHLPVCSHYFSGPSGREGGRRVQVRWRSAGGQGLGCLAEHHVLGPCGRWLRALLSHTDSVPWPGWGPESVSGHQKMVRVRHPLLVRPEHPPPLHWAYSGLAPSTLAFPGYFPFIWHAVSLWAFLMLPGLGDLVHVGLSNSVIHESVLG